MLLACLMEMGQGLLECCTELIAETACEAVAETAGVGINAAEAVASSCTKVRFLSLGMNLAGMGYELAQNEGTAATI